MNAPNETFETTMTRFVRATPAQVYAAFVQPELLARWQCPRGLTAQASVDLRVGGRYRLDMLARDGSHHVAVGEFTALEPGRRVCYTWTWEGGGPIPEGMNTLVEVDLAARNGGTELTMRHSGFHMAAVRDGHVQGWASVFNKLNDLLDPEGTAATLVLLGDPRSTYVRTVRMAFAEKGVAVTLKPAAPHSPEVLAVNPLGRIPALLDGPVPLWETSAIVRWVDECFGEAPLLVPTAGISARLQCERWVSMVNAHLYDTMVRRYVLQYVFPKGAGGAPDRAVIDAAVPEMAKQLTLLDQAYASGSDFLAGGALSMADLFVAPIMAYVSQMPEGRQLFTDLPHLRRAQAAIAARPSFKATEPPRS
jgi:glutathione S-transferase